MSIFIGVECPFVCVFVHDIIIFTEPIYDIKFNYASIREVGIKEEKKNKNPVQWYKQELDGVVFEYMATAVNLKKNEKLIKVKERKKLKKKETV